MEESRLLDKAMAGDQAALEALLAIHEKKMYAICLRMFKHREDAQDCLQEAMLRVFRSLKSFKRESALSTWIYRLTTNTCLDELRRRKSRPSVSMDGLMETGWMPADEGDGPDEAYIKRERRSAVHAAIEELPDDMRAVIVLRDIEGFSYDEVSQITGVNVGTVKSRISRGRARLREVMSQKKELFSDVGV